MAWLSKWSFGYKYTAGILALTALLMGVLHYTSLPMEFTPEAGRRLGGGTGQETGQNIRHAVKTDVNGTGERQKWSGEKPHWSGPETIERLALTE
ncbi:hypothetical protein [Paenibacillus tepidiphilus]|uniref:hypothetical protein n=1 Tax=Paenibacillus tepidiphilus TaxID=2608683 RepID=UPI0012385695|nr:hypothetical protein [Paenibacillus tepidiphilus]